MELYVTLNPLRGCCGGGINKHIYPVAKEGNSDRSGKNKWIKQIFHVFAFNGVNVEKNLNVRQKKAKKSTSGYNLIIETLQNY